MGRPIIVGMNNPLSMRPEHALYPAPRGCAGHRLWSVLHDACGASRSDYLRAFERVNLVTGEWSSPAAQMAASAMLPRLASRRVALLGTEVWRAFELDAGAEVLSCSSIDVVLSIVPRHVEMVRFYRVPHPSGRNRWFNDPINRAAVGRLLGDLYKGAAS